MIDLILENLVSFYFKLFFLFDDLNGQNFVFLQKYFTIQYQSKFIEHFANFITLILYLWKIPTFSNFYLKQFGFSFSLYLNHFHKFYHANLSFLDHLFKAIISQQIFIIFIKNHMLLIFEMKPFSNLSHKSSSFHLIFIWKSNFLQIMQVYFISKTFNNILLVLKYYSTSYNEK